MTRKITQFPEPIDELAELIGAEHDWLLGQYPRSSAREQAARWVECGFTAEQAGAWLGARVHDPEVADQLCHTPHERITAWRIDPQAAVLWEQHERVDGYDPDELAVTDSILGGYTDTAGHKLASGLIQVVSTDDRPALAQVLAPVTLGEVDSAQIEDIREKITGLHAALATNTGWGTKERDRSETELIDLLQLLWALTPGLVVDVDEQGGHVDQIGVDGIEAAMEQFPDYDFDRNWYTADHPDCRGFRYWRGERRHV